MSFQTETASFNVTLAASSNLPNNTKSMLIFHGLYWSCDIFLCVLLKYIAQLKIMYVHDSIPLFLPDFLQLLQLFIGKNTL